MVGNDTMVEILVNNANFIAKFKNPDFNVTIPNAVTATSAIGVVHIGISIGWNGNADGGGMLCFSAY